jgi:hypothetical protein
VERDGYSSKLTLRQPFAPFTGERSALVLFTHERDLRLGMGIERDFTKVLKKKSVSDVTERVDGMPAVEEEEEESDEESMVEEDTDEERK